MDFLHLFISSQKTGIHAELIAFQFSRQKQSSNRQKRFASYSALFQYFLSKHVARTHDSDSN